MSLDKMFNGAILSGMKTPEMFGKHRPECSVIFNVTLSILEKVAYSAKDLRIESLILEQLLFIGIRNYNGADYAYAELKMDFVEFQQIPKYSY